MSCRFSFRDGGGRAYYFWLLLAFLSVALAIPALVSLNLGVSHRVFRWCVRVSFLRGPAATPRRGGGLGHESFSSGRGYCDGQDDCKDDGACLVLWRSVGDCVNVHLFTKDFQLSGARRHAIIIAALVAQNKT